MPYALVSFLTERPACGCVLQPTKDYVMNVLTQALAIFASLIAAALVAVAVWYLLIALAWLIAVLVCLAAGLAAGAFVYAKCTGATMLDMSAGVLSAYAAVASRFTKA